jgi:hypothetical protein
MLTLHEAVQILFTETYALRDFLNTAFCSGQDKVAVTDFWYVFVNSLDAKTLVTLVSAGIAGISLYFTRRFWFEANRPIVSASIVRQGETGVTTPYNLVVYNTGNRPATSIRLHAKKEDIDEFINTYADPYHADIIYKCFPDKILIPLLVNGKDASTGFGTISDIPKEDVLVYDAQLQILISYSDLNHKEYKSNQILIVANSKGFAGAEYSMTTQP